MKKHILSIVFISLLFPSFVFAAWWNPLSWFNDWSFVFDKKEDKSVKILESKIKDLESKLENNSFDTSNKEYSESNQKNEEQTEQEVIVKEKIIYVEKPVNNVDSVSVKNEDTSSEIDTSNSGVNIVYSYIDQGTYESYYGGEYGSILLGLRISTDKDIYIPQTTTDSSGSNIGFSYAVAGDFVGRRESKVGCSLKSEGYCKIKAGSIDKEITVNVWIFPEKPGEYSLNFKKLGYKHEPKGLMNYIDINKTADPLYVNY